ncbi:MAG: tetratricopeptide repeat protein, partial [Cyanobacteria bacterium NC_groundwater_1444_Ag_S-0.65um_54_12]|nr:tetratricopeptide repeat protein [Cyanobacteria bacterium NC_groundwater_1444_Ag_S-0.65um_54_12]
MTDIFVIRRKLRIPLLPQGQLRREHLLKSIKLGLDPYHQLTLVHAGPGFGKSTLVADYAGWTGLPVIWYNLFEEDSDLLVFMAHLVAGCQERFPDLSAEPLALLRAANNPALVIGSAIGLLCEELANSVRGPFLLVLDDFQTIDLAPGIKEATEALIRFFPEEAQFLIISRTQPGLNLPQLRIRQQLVEVGSEMLKLTPVEIAHLFAAQRGLAVTGDELAALTTQTEGWFASVLLAMRAELPLRTTDLSEQLGDFLFQEVYDRQEPEFRRFLLQTALLPRLDASLCSVVLEIDYSGRWLSLIWERNLFVTLLGTSDGAPAYQFHPIFRSFLQKRAASELTPFEYRQIQRRLGDRLLEESPAVALELLLAAGDTSYAMQRLDEIGWRLLRSQRVETVAKILVRLPDDLSANAITAQLMAGEVARARGDFDGALDHYAKARDLSQRAADPRGAGLALALTAAALGARGNDRQQEAAIQALAVLPDTEHFGRAMAHNALGVWHLFSDQTAKALEQFDLALERYRQAMDFAGQARVLHNTGLAQARLGNFVQAMAHYRDSIRLSQRAGRWALPMTYNNLALLAGYLGQFEQGLQEARRALELARQLSESREEAFALWTFGELYLRQERHREALDYFQQAKEAAIALGDRPQEAMALAGEAMLEVHGGNGERALTLLRQSLQLRGYRANDPTCGDLIYPLAKAYLKVGNSAEATRILNEARAYLEQHNYRFRLVQVLLDLYQASGKESKTYFDQAQAIALEYGYQHLLTSESAGTATGTSSLPIPEIAIWSFGTFRVEVAGQELAQRDWRGYKTKLILAYLLGKRRGATKEELAELFYSDQDTTRSAIHVLISRLRQALEPNLAKSQASRFIRLVEGRYIFDFAINYWWDAREFEYHHSRGRDASLPETERLVAMQAAIDRYQGSYLAEFASEPWCQLESEHYRRKAETAFNLLADHAETNRKYEELLQIAERNLQRDPT